MKKQCPLNDRKSWLGGKEDAGRSSMGCGSP